jgi:hypothetical protein
MSRPRTVILAYHRIFEGNAFRIVLLEPLIGRIQLDFVIVNVRHHLAEVAQVDQRAAGQAVAEMLDLRPVGIVDITAGLARYFNRIDLRRFLLSSA